MVFYKNTWKRNMRIKKTKRYVPTLIDYLWGFAFMIIPYVINIIKKNTLIRTMLVLAIYHIKNENESISYRIQP